MTERKGQYGADSDIVDYILGITFEIWEERGVELIHQYYADDVVVYGLDGITHGASAVVDATRETLKAFPDRVLLAENVIWSDDGDAGKYTSHRLLTIMTNEGPTRYGPATGTRVRMTNIADCVVEDGVITREWLVRDNMTLATQLGADPHRAARVLATARTSELEQWIAAEHARVSAAPPVEAADVHPEEDPTAFAWLALQACWRGDRQAFDRLHAPYNVLHRSPLRHYSGRNAVFDYYQGLRAVLGDVRYSVDHVASQPYETNGIDIAVRWSVAGTHAGDIVGASPTGGPIYILGISHWRCIAGRIAIEMTIFDDLAVLAQALVT